MPKTVVALYDDFGNVNDVIRDLVDRGVPRDDISIIANDDNRRYSQFIEREQTVRPPDESGAAEGAGVGASIGALVGGIGGLLAGLGALMIPVIGPVVAAGPLAVALTGLAGAGAGALAGGLTGGLIGALVDLGVPEETAGYYLEGVRRGGTLVAVRAADERAGDVRAILNRHNPVDLAERSEAWRRTGWAGPTQTVYTLSEADEQAFRQHFDTSPYARREGYDRYAPAYRYGYLMGITPGVSERTWGDVESHLRQDWDTRQYGPWEEFRDAIHYGFSQASERNEMEFSSFEDHFQTRFTQTPHAGTGDYDQYRPAYRFGWNMGTNPRYFEYEWADIEEDLRQNWEMQNLGAWEDYQHAVREGWETQRSRAFAVPATGRPLTGEDVIEVGSREMPARFEDYDEVFRQHFETGPFSQNTSYTAYEPAYRYGFDLGSRMSRSGQRWDDVEPEARHEWELQRPESWNDFRDAVRLGWEQSRRGR